MEDSKVMESFVKLKNLTESHEVGLGNTFEAMAKSLQDSGEKGSIQFRILRDDEHLYWCIELGSKANKVKTIKVEQPTLEIVTRADTWWQIAKSSLSPLDAFLQGKMRIRGDVDLGKRLLRRLALSEGKLDIC